MEKEITVFKEFRLLNMFNLFLEKRIKQKARYLPSFLFDDM